MKPKKAVLGSKGRWQNFYSAAFTGGNVSVVGTRGGELYVFKAGRKCIMSSSTSNHTRRTRLVPARGGIKLG